MQKGQGSVEAGIELLKSVLKKLSYTHAVKILLTNFKNTAIKLIG